MFSLIWFALLTCLIVGRLLIFCYFSMPLTRLVIILFWHGKFVFTNYIEANIVR